MRERLPQRIIVFCLPGIGDALLFTPALAALRRAFPAAHITVITMFRGTADLLETNPDLDEVRWFDFFNSGTWQGLRYVWGLRRERFDLSVLPFPANRAEYNLVSRLAGRRWRAGHRYRRQSWRNLWFLNDIVVREDGTRHNLAENLDLVAAICRHAGVPTPAVGTTPTLRLTADDVEHARRFLAEHRLSTDDVLIGLHTFSSTFKNMHRKCWDRDNFVQLIRRIGDALPRARVLLFSGPSDVAVNAYIMRNSDARTVLVELPNLRWTLAILRHCRLFVSNDSAMMHLAAALGVPVVALFGPTDWRRLHPWDVAHRIVRRDLPCMPCFYYSSRPLRCAANLDYACLREITVDEVLAAVGALVTET